MKKQPYIAIIGDIKDSRQLINRNQIQENFEKLLIQINIDYQAYIIADFQITSGDSFQGLVSIESPFMDMLLDIEMALHPVSFRFGIGIGSISTTINKAHSSYMDGPAYHFANEMIEAVEEREDQNEKSQTNILIKTIDPARYQDQLLNTIFELLTAIRSRWTKRQIEIIKAYLANNSNQYQAANNLGISQSSVNKAINNASYYSYKNASTTINQAISHHAKEV